jgi:hypothetical protein
MLALRRCSQVKRLSGPETGYVGELTVDRDMVFWSGGRVVPGSPGRCGSACKRIAVVAGAALVGAAAAGLNEESNPNDFRGSPNPSPTPPSACAPATSGPRRGFSQ